MRGSRTVGSGVEPAWITRAEAAFLARVPVQEIDRRIAGGRLAHRRVGSLMLVEASGLDHSFRPPAEAREALLAAHRPPLPRGALVVAAVAGTVVVALVVLQLTVSAGRHRAGPAAVAAAAPPPPASTSTMVPVGRDPFASPFGAPGPGDEHGAVLVKPPGVVRDGGEVVAAATVVNQSESRWLPPSEVTFVARDDTGRVIARTTTTVSLGPGRAQTVVAPNLEVDPATIAAIEARIHPAPLRSGRYPAPAVSVTRASVTEGGKAIAGTLAVGSGAGTRALLACAVFDPLDELAGVSTSTVDLGRARDGRLRFWLTVQPTGTGPYRAACSAS